MAFLFKGAKWAYRLLSESLGCLFTLNIFTIHLFILQQIGRILKNNTFNKNSMALQATIDFLQVTY